jgi:hypothetical protein
VAGNSARRLANEPFRSEITCPGRNSLRDEVSSMKAYLITTSVIFALIVVAHVSRIVYEGTQVASDPWFVLLTALAVALCVWAIRLLMLFNRRQSAS